jgi:hypothetical protein
MAIVRLVSTSYVAHAVCVSHDPHDVAHLGYQHSTIGTVFWLQLVVADQDLTLAVGSIRVRGRLLIGSLQCPLTSNVLIRFQKPAGEFDLAEYGIVTEAGEPIAPKAGLGTSCRRSLSLHAGVYNRKACACGVAQWDANNIWLRIVEAATQALNVHAPAHPAALSCAPQIDSAVMGASN